MQRKLITLVNCQLVEDEGRARALRAARSLGERTVTELILQHQNPQQLSSNLWASVRGRGCQFLGPGKCYLYYSKTLWLSPIVLITLEKSFLNLIKKKEKRLVNRILCIFSFAMATKVKKKTLKKSSPPKPLIV